MQKPRFPDPGAGVRAAFLLSGFLFAVFIAGMAAGVALSFLFFRA